MYIYFPRRGVHAFRAKQITRSLRALDYRNQINVDFPASRSSIFSGLACSACVSLPPFLSFLSVSHSPVSVPLAPLLFLTLSPTHPLDFFRFRCKQAGAHVPTVRHGINHSLIGKSQRANTVADGRQIRGTGKREGWRRRRFVRIGGSHVICDLHRCFPTASLVRSRAIHLN